ncbi:MAG: hypothetical protein NTY48_06155, partial [Candidatus Diapherotrites archaeon]|nr:hypothetical protein [Candidatus Diapherotrites archaeon]
MQMPEDEVKNKLVEIGQLIALEGFRIVNDKQMKLVNYPDGGSIKNKRGITFSIIPLNPKHLQIIGQKKGIIQIVPYIDLV